MSLLGNTNKIDDWEDCSDWVNQSWNWQVEGWDEAKNKDSEHLFVYEKLKESIDEIDSTIDEISDVVEDVFVLNKMNNIKTLLKKIDKDAQYFNTRPENEEFSTFKPLGAKSATNWNDLQKVVPCEDWGEDINIKSKKSKEKFEFLGI